MPNTIHQILQQYFGYNSFRPLQQSIIESVLAGNDTLALLPTGGGKSVCYQVPALAMPGLCLVVTPLIALMKDQAGQLKKRNVSVLVIHSGMAFYEVKKALENAINGNFKFLFVSPERLQTKLFKDYLPGMPLNLIAVDEAHCISQWGYDFRPPYLLIATIREEKPDVPVLALTASATPDVQADICEKLHFARSNIFQQSFERPNLSYSAMATPTKMGKLLRILQNVPGTALVYVRNRRRTREIASLLNLEGIAASFYHAGLTHIERNTRQEQWLQDKIRVMVCTNAFGMGIDKANVRSVIHLDIPDCVESYYQEAGRAGRDGLKSYAVLLFTPEELNTLRQLPEKKFPDLEKLRLVYQAVCNYLQVPVGSGEGQYYDFSIESCCEKFNLDAVLLAQALQTLAIEGYLSFSDRVFMQPRVRFVISKENLHAFEMEKPALEPLIKSLLRSYEGIFNNEVSISEKTLARQLEWTEEKLARGLKALQQYGVIEYEPLKDTPQIFFIYSRVPANELSIDKPAYEKRKQAYRQKIEQMVAYVLDHEPCRAQTIGLYFGDKQQLPCGVCDNCLAKKTQTRMQLKLAEWSSQVMEQLSNHQPSMDELQHALKISLPELELVIQHLVREEKISWNDEGRFMHYS